MTYTLTAKLAGTGTSRYTFSETNLAAAMREANDVITTRATNGTIWSKGTITLTNANGLLVNMKGN